AAVRAARVVAAGTRRTGARRPGPPPAAVHRHRGILTGRPCGGPPPRERSDRMCGLTGEITFDGSPADTDAVGRMVEAVVPRGPDGQGAWSAGRVAFGHRRLSVIDLSPCGAQPMVDNEL